MTISQFTRPQHLRTVPPGKRDLTKVNPELFIHVHNELSKFQMSRLEDELADIEDGDEEPCELPAGSEDLLKQVLDAIRENLSKKS
jgi:hypothetical protein